MNGRVSHSPETDQNIWAVCANQISRVISTLMTPPHFQWNCNVQCGSTSCDRFSMKHHHGFSNEPRAITQNYTNCACSFSDCTSATLLFKRHQSFANILQELFSFIEFSATKLFHSSSASRGYITPTYSLQLTSAFNISVRSTSPPTPSSSPVLCVAI